jgi:hypothetical protein
MMFVETNDNSTSSNTKDILNVKCSTDASGNEKFFLYSRKINFFKIVFDKVGKTVSQIISV